MHQRAARLALVCIGMSVLGLAAAWALYDVPARGYSPLNHNISELGAPGGTPWAWAFRFAMLASGVSYGSLVLALNAYARAPGMMAIGLIGFITALSTAAVGMYPTTHTMGDMHTRVAAVSFLGSLLFSLLYTLYVLPRRTPLMPRWTGVLSGCVTLVIGVFMFLPVRLFPDLDRQMVYIIALHEPDRPAIWWPSILEWAVLVAMMAWSVAVAIYLMRAKLRTD